jgi:hypothetical protein
MAWYWKDDDGQWVAYGKSVTTKLEKAYKAKQKKVRVDVERYVDLGVSPFKQRRYDNPTGRSRDVKREQRKIFQEAVIKLIGELSKSHDEWMETIGEHGGLVAWGFHERVRISILHEDDERKKK